MNKYSDYNIISLGDHCAIPMILKQLNLRKNSYPFDWVTNKNQYDTNIIYNIQLINELSSSDNIDNIVKKYIGNICNNNEYLNINNNIWFPYDIENITDVFQKYKRRFTRLKNDLDKKNVFILLTRFYYIEKNIFEQIIEILLNYNSNSIILFISGINHTYFENINNKNVIFKYIYYDITQYYNYDYTSFRPNIKTFLSDFFINN